VRIAIISTPRSGNTWLRHILSASYGPTGIMAHSPIDVDWAHLPGDCVLQIHWHRVDSFVDRLEHYGFRVIALARHPFDVLISILQFALYNSTARWLEGEEGNEASILGAMPRSDAFLGYAVRPRAAVLLGLTREWWSFPGCLRVKYEDLVERPERAISSLSAALGRRFDRPVREIIAETSLDKLRSQTRGDHHFWQGKVGSWRTLLTEKEADLLRKAHGKLCEELDYACAADSGLTGETADANWIRLAWSTLADKIQNARILQDTVQKMEQKLKCAEGELARVKARFEEFERATQAAQAEYEPADLDLARKLHQMAVRFPRLFQQARRAARLGRWLRVAHASEARG
jgi:hypothetical protein